MAGPSAVAGPSRPTRARASKKGKERAVELPESITLAASELYDLFNQMEVEQTAFTAFVSAVYKNCDSATWLQLREEVAKQSEGSADLLDEMLSRLQDQAASEDAAAAALASAADSIEIEPPSGTPRAAPASHLLSPSRAQQKRTVSPAALGIINETVQKRSASAGNLPTKAATIAARYAGSSTTSNRRKRGQSYESVIEEQTAEEDQRVYGLRARSKRSKTPESRRLFDPEMQEGLNGAPSFNGDDSSEEEDNSADDDYMQDDDHMSE